MTYKSESELVYSNYYVRLGGSHNYMALVNAANPAAAVQQFLRDHPSNGETCAWAWRVSATEDGREVLGDAGIPSYHQFSSPHVSNCEGMVEPVTPRPAVKDQS